ncbi:MAG: adenylosuccinate synthase [Candidatus Diapherotrites archaeon]|uniref:Adenylosuccinate synthetase n=1 Tax=Candidatus Iainarchaeum sp. TaxID=3101447 RepID=A0A938YVC4_9ARCH|nr:adenylosuccinate synthase [Candidatus Diapherotrites archaeon]
MPAKQFPKAFSRSEKGFSIAVIGSQYGDEGKGKVVDLLAEKADLVVRFGGGNNAGHTVVVKGKKYKFHLMPSGAIQGKKCCIAAGVALDPRVLKQELEQLTEFKFALVIDPRVQIIMPWHNLLDATSEQAKGKQKIGTTGRGIGPCYADRADRTGIRFVELIERERLKERLEAVFPIKEKILKAVYNSGMEISKEQIFKEYSALGEYFKQYLGDVSLLVSDSLKQGKNVMFEGAQGTFLDIDFGTYPYVTSSHPTAGSIFTGVGIGVMPIERVIGIVKAYTTRVGSGPFVAELEGKLGDSIREAGAEFGTTTGRPRRVGWLDLVLLRTSQRLNGFTEMALTKLDVLNGLDEISVCTEYELGGKRINERPADIEDLKNCRPLFKKFKGFSIPKDVKAYSELPEEARQYVEFIEKELNVPIKIVSVGPDRKETLFR